METAKKKITPVTYTCKEALRRHRGVKHHAITRMCTRGEALLRRYGARESIPLGELRKRPALFAIKVGKLWQIPAEELDRVFLGASVQKFCANTRGGRNEKRKLQARQV